MARSHALHGNAYLNPSFIFELKAPLGENQMYNLLYHLAVDLTFSLS